MKHIDVLTKEIMTIVNPRDKGVYIDMTLGAGGHTKELLRLSAPTGIVIAFDKDIDAIENGEKLKDEFKDRLILINDDFSNLEEHLDRLNIEKVDGIIFDLGVSLDQLKSKKGFSFNIDAPLDMRMDRTRTLTAERIVNHWDLEDLEKILKLYGEERFAKRIAKAIVKNRPISSTKQLASIIEVVVPRNVSRRTHPATRTFQALRIVVNDELESLQVGLKAAIKRLTVGGVVCVISFHSLEDRIVKQTFKDYKQRGILRVITKKPIRPTPEEIKRNRHARSARLRCAIKIVEEDCDD